MKNITALALLFSLLTFSCSKDYFIADQFKQKTASHKTIAILPFQVTTTGNVPLEITEEQLQEIRDAESRAFQISLYNEILASTQSGSKPLKVDVQSPDLTVSLLSEGIMNFNDINSIDPQLLASMLGVDALVTSSVDKTRYMSDLASFGISLGRKLLGLFGDDAAVLLNDGKTADILLVTKVIDPSNGTVLWNFDYKGEADYSKPSNEIIDLINRKAAKRFPYR